MLSEAQISNALKSDEGRKAVWEAYKQAWLAQKREEMSGDVFRTLFYGRELAADAAALANRSKLAFTQLKTAAARAGAKALADCDSRSVVEAVFAGAGRFMEFWQLARQQRLSAAETAELAGAIIRATIRVEGRQAARGQLAKIWGELELEEEREAALEAYDQNAEPLSLAFLRELGGDAVLLAQRLSRWGELRVDAALPEAPAIRSSRGTSLVILKRVASLLDTMRIAMELRDSGLQPKEVSQLWESPAGRLGALATIAELLDDEGIEPREWVLERLRRRRFEIPVLGTRARKLPLAIEFHLIQVLHMRELLGAPSLSRALVDPLGYLCPALFLRMIDQEPVSYVPELRLASNGEKRWRAKWAESMGEALSVLFMDAAIGITLTTLARIPESTGPTADFQAKSSEGEPLVFESKGATDWSTHSKQRQRALTQLGKRGRERASSSGLEPGRAFACCLYASSQGDDRSSLLHVEDPPFQFAHLFHSGWEDLARRQHFAAVLEFAGETETARALRRGVELGAEAKRSPQGEHMTFRLGPGRRDQTEDAEGEVYVGMWDDLEEMARRARLSVPEALAGVRVFRGLPAGIYRTLSLGQLPDAPPESSSLGLIQPEQGSASGVFSRLSNGSLLAVQVG